MGWAPMMRLAGNFSDVRGQGRKRSRQVRRLSSDENEVRADADRLALILEPGAVAPDDLTCVAVLGQGCSASSGAMFYELPADCDYVAPGDIMRIEEASNRFRVLYRKASSHNNFLVTERCDNYCLMCSQPPKAIDDGWVLGDLYAAIELLDPTAKSLGFTGGEPTLLGDRFIGLLKRSRERLPATAVHVLSNGRRFSDESFAEQWASIDHSDLMLGIPVYSDLSATHDYIVQADGAYDQTLRGILNLKKRRQRVEIRVVLHKQTFDRLPQLARFIARNFLFVDHVAFMGLEITGFTRANLSQLWIDPVDYQAQLYDAVSLLNDFGVPTSIYNLQLCLLDRRLWKFAVSSISDWKREYFPQCAACAVQPRCGGVFTSAKLRHSDHIAPVVAEPA